MISLISPGHLLRPEKSRRGVLMGAFGADRLLHPGDFALQFADIGAQLLNPQQVQRRRNKQFFWPWRRVILGKYHGTILTGGWHGFHTRARYNSSPASE